MIFSKDPQTQTIHNPSLPQSPSLVIHTLQFGLTLIELLMVIGILGIIGFLAVPDFSHSLQKSQAKSVSLSLLTRFMEARQAALSLGNSVVLCPANPDHTTVDHEKSGQSISCGKNWNHGSMTFVDNNFNQALDHTEQLISGHHEHINHGHIRLRVFTNRNHLRFKANGLLHHYTAGNFTYCPNNGDTRYARQIIFNRLGRARIAQDIDQDGYRENAKRQAIDCPET